MPNYANSSVYKLLKQDDYDNTNIYIGSTTNFRGRKNGHKTCCNNDNDKRHNLKVYQFIRDNGGWEEWTMIQLEAFPCETKKELETRERYWIEQMKPVLNCMIPTRTHKEWDDDTKYHKEYREKNKKVIAEKKQVYHKKNKEVIKEKKDIYYQNNKEIYLEKAKEYRENNKEQIVEKRKEIMTCECGCILTKDSLRKHIKTQTHIKLIEEKNNIIE